MRKGVHGPLALSGNSPPPELVYDPPTDTGLNVLHVDEDILVLSKPAGLLSVPGNSADLQDCMERRAQSQLPTARTVHRLDRPTSGIFLMALNAEAHRRLGIQFEKRSTSKTYKAIVSGVVLEDEGAIEQALRTDWYNRPKQMVDNCLGREAITRWQVLERHSASTRMELRPITGRSHQLRVHMQWLGYPIMGDEFYVNDQNEAPRLMLHAETLEIFHPATNERLEFVDPCPF
ncbi:MAG: RluA family pseudouridine synthase [Rhizobiaceae bacterium]|nr:RluA family pseudouridine synthase [Rhizobiaceae bacterium]